MIELTLDEIIEATGGKASCALPKAPLTGISLDSRKVMPGGLFVALKGEKVDGHSFVSKLEGVAAAALVEHKVDCAVPQIVVGSTYRAVGSIARCIREKSGVIVVGVTGSVGKTTAKEMTAAVISRRFCVHKTEKNHNNELGLPITLFALEPEHEVAVLEMGISFFGEMSRISAVARPDIAIFTNIENVHTENLGDRDGVLRAKTELVANMRGNTLILNAEDDKLASYKLPNGKKAVYYGFSPSCFTYASDVVYNGMDSASFTLHMGKDSIDVLLPVSGRHHVLDALAAAAAGHELGLTMEEIKSGLESFKNVGGRMERISYNGAVIINDCYNASPASMCASLDVLSRAGGRRLALLGDMLELGENETELHRTVGRKAAQIGLDALITVGHRARYIGEAAEEAGVKNVVCSDKDGAAGYIASVLKEGDTLLVKASRGMALEDVISKLINGGK